LVGPRHLDGGVRFHALNQIDVASHHAGIEIVTGRLGAVLWMLGKAHCSLGKVNEPHGHHGALVVTTQNVRAGRKLAKGASVAVKLGPVRG